MDVKKHRRVITWSGRVIWDSWPQFVGIGDDVTASLCKTIGWWCGLARITTMARTRPNAYPLYAVTEPTSSFLTQTLEVMPAGVLMVGITYPSPPNVAKNLYEGIITLDCDDDWFKFWGLAVQLPSLWEPPPFQICLRGWISCQLPFRKICVMVLKKISTSLKTTYVCVHHSRAWEK